MQHQGPIAAQLQVVAKAFTSSDHLQMINTAPALQRPVIDPRPERLGLHPRLADTAARQGFARLMAARVGQRRVAHPQVRAVPAGGLGAGAQGRAEQRPLRAPVPSQGVLEVGGDIPPLDAKAIVGTVVAWKLQAMVAGYLAEFARLLPESGIALLRWLITAAQQPTQQQPRATVHRQTASTVRSAGDAPVATGARRWPTGW
ncbi:hypothetical protein D3C80_1361160 [compost metagenome]